MSAIDQLKEGRARLVKLRDGEGSQTSTVYQLYNSMSALSEDRWSAGWLIDLEYHLWELATESPTKIDLQNEIQQLIGIIDLALDLNGWLMWDDHPNDEIPVKLVSFEEWERFYRTWKQKIDAKVKTRGSSGPSSSPGQ